MHEGWEHEWEVIIWWFAIWWFRGDFDWNARGQWGHAKGKICLPARKGCILVMCSDTVDEFDELNVQYGHTNSSSLFFNNVCFFPCPFFLLLEIGTQRVIFLEVVRFQRAHCLQ